MVTFSLMHDQSVLNTHRSRLSGRHSLVAVVCRPLFFQPPFQQLQIAKHDSAGLLLMQKKGLRFGSPVPVYPPAACLTRTNYHGRTEAESLLRALTGAFGTAKKGFANEPAPF